MFETPDVDVAAARMDSEGVTYAGVQRVRRLVQADVGAEHAPIGLLEIDEAVGLSPEGRGLTLVPDSELAIGTRRRSDLPSSGPHPDRTAVRLP